MNENNSLEIATRIFGSVGRVAVDISGCRRKVFAWDVLLTFANLTPEVTAWLYRWTVDPRLSMFTSGYRRLSQVRGVKPPRCKKNRANVRKTLEDYRRGERWSWMSFLNCNFYIFTIKKNIYIYMKQQTSSGTHIHRLCINHMPAGSRVIDWNILLSLLLNIS